MFVAVINDSRDDNALARQAVRAASLLKYPVITVGVDSDLEASGNLIDVLDASLGKRGVVLVNVAPRFGDAKKWENGSPFGYFFHQDTLVVSTIDGWTLSLVKKLNLAKTVRLLDVEKVLKDITGRGLISEELADEIANSQFRSFEFLPRVASWLLNGVDMPTDEFSLKSLDMPRGNIWLIDCFGNAKTTILPDEINFEDGRSVKTVIGELKCWHRLANVPDGKVAFIIGSSGIGKKRFVELVIQGASAADRFSLKVGDNLI